MLSARALKRIYIDYRNHIRAKNTFETCCYMIARAIDRKDKRALLGLGIGLNEANMVIEWVSKKERTHVVA